MELAFFLILSLVAVAAAFNMVFGRNPLYCALSLVVVFLITAVLYVMLHSPFLAVLQVIVYAGAIMVLFVFVIMLLNLSSRRESGEGREGAPSGSKRVIAVVLGSVLVAQIALLAFFLTRGDSPVDVFEGTPQALGRSLFQNYIIPFEMAGILLLVAIVGAIALTRRHGRGLEGTMRDDLDEEEEA